ncbi:CDP-glycerol glycerophosphotransferase family protein [Lacticaseibacillus rhamnosus]|uniref:CDP-glycerol glycerophosphotransferase family protein n=1 Tax=Lacticaseibacillus rhamnosus TaxID=47715 RepID=UPI0021A5DF5D|nr:CDP-glycerol glycerophosphotransferase family protein [Lacticaseibacillus rhamnosus]MCT3192171.1 CDP-glycerol glycerophosphotransferase family protein [Lacticaseibacillus rhamnosus]MCT3371257.1 CDP-glycerol glycerophosphotransferase family protein [Lacticaseibacillus rhamnosus]
MKAKATILTILLAVFYPFTFLVPFHRNRITFISLEHANLSKDFKVLYDRLCKSGQYDLKLVLFKFEPTIWGNFRYGLACVRQLFAVASSRLVLLDYNNFVIAKFPHRQRTKVMQVWHATGALKKFGNAVRRDYAIQHYDYAIVNSDFYQPIFAEAFNVPEAQVLVTGIPNNDKLFSTDFVSTTRARLLAEYPQLQGKKVVTYAPTFRGRITTAIHEVEADLAKVKAALGDDYVVVYKAHPLVEHSKYNHVPGVYELGDELISSTFCVTDVLVTDYSAIAIDWMVFDKPVISFAPDYKGYHRRPGFFIDYRHEFPGPITRNEAQLVAEIQSVDTPKAQAAAKRRRERFSHKVYRYMDGQSTGRVVAAIETIMQQV